MAAGFSALLANTAGSNNMAIGESALGTDIMGSYNTAVEFGTDVSSSNLTNAIAIGNGDLVNARTRFNWATAA